MSRRSRKIDLNGMRLEAERRTDFEPSDFTFDGKTGETQPCVGCAGTGLVANTVCTDCAGYGVRLTKRESALRAQARRWRQVKAETMKRLGVSEEDIDEAEYAEERAWEREYEKELAQEETLEDEERTPELRYDSHGVFVGSPRRRGRQV